MTHDTMKKTISKQHRPRSRRRTSSRPGLARIHRARARREGGLSFWGKAALLLGVVLCAMFVLYDGKSLLERGQGLILSARTSVTGAEGIGGTAAGAGKGRTAVTKEAGSGMDGEGSGVDENGKGSGSDRGGDGTGEGTEKPQDQPELTGPGPNQDFPLVQGADPWEPAPDGAVKAMDPDQEVIAPRADIGSGAGGAMVTAPSVVVVPEDGNGLPGGVIRQQGPVDPSKPMLAFTFDDGPFTKVDQRILDVLEAYGGRATFFIVGSRVNDYKDTLSRIHRSGSEIGNHTYNHKNLEKLPPEEVAAQVEMASDAVEAVTGFRPRLVRVPYGAFQGQVPGLVAYPMIQWNIDTEDWSSRDKDTILSVLLSQARDGSIILMHDLYPATAEAFEEAIPILVSQGYQLVTVSEMYAAKGVPLEAGQVYFNIHQ